MQNLADLTAVILAGGLGTRLRSIVSDRPKVLAKVHNRPFLAYLLRYLATSGIKQVVLCTGYMGEQVQDAFGKSYAGLRILYSQEKSLLGTAGALRLALPLIHSDVVLVMNGDSLCKTNLNKFWDWHSAQNAKASILLTHMSDTSRYGRVYVNDKGSVLRFAEKSSNSESGWINAGTYLLAHSLLKTIPTEQTISLEKEIFPNWITSGLYGYSSSEEFLDIGIPEAYALAEQFLALEASA